MEVGALCSWFGNWTLRRRMRAAMSKARRRADQLAADEDVDGQLAWIRAMQAAEALLRKRTSADPVS